MRNHSLARCTVESLLISKSSQAEDVGLPAFRHWDKDEAFNFYNKHLSSVSIPGFLCPSFDTDAVGRKGLSTMLHEDCDLA